MTFRKTSLTVFFVLCLLCVVQAAYYYPLLPERIASHFGPSGRPDAWSAKASFITFYLIIVAILFLLFPTISFAVSKIPVSFINLPNKEYWLSPARKQQTIEYLSYSFLWFASATMLLLLDIMHQIFQVQNILNARKQEVNHGLPPGPASTGKQY